jgi:LPXTG-site transpeptidase (sortase) family protein
MFQFRFQNLAIAIGIILIYSGLASSAAEIQQAATNLQEESFRSIDVPIESEIPGFLSSSISPTFKNQIEDAPTINAERTIRGEIIEASEAFLAINPNTTAIEPAKDVSKQSFPVSPAAPVRITIPTIELDAPVVQAEIRWVEASGGEKYQQWGVPDFFAAGWHETSARLGEMGNTVFNGHNNIYGEVFRRLDELLVGDLIQVHSDSYAFEYVITNTMILPERFQEMDVRMSNAQWILPSEDQRLTLISCWPYESNTHRVIVVAKLISIEDQSRNYEQNILTIQ